MSDQIAQSFCELGPVSVFHHLGAYHSQPPLKTIARSADDVVMAIRHESLPIHGVMWHPEREKNLKVRHAEYLKTIFVGDE